MAASAHAAASTSPYIALGLLSGTKNQDRRTIIRQVSNNLDSYVSGRIALRFVLSVPPLSPIRAELLDAERDLVLLDGRETPFRCGLKYVLWFDVALRTFPTAAYVAAGDDDAYIQLSHFEADLRLVHAQAGAAPTLYGLFQWRSHYDNVTMDTSTGFMGWLFDDSRAMAVRRSMEACRDEVRDVSPQRRATLLAELLAAKPGKDAARKGATELPTPAAAAAFPRCADVAAIRAARREAHLDPTEKRISAILLGRVEWELPPFPVANGPLFAVSRTLASMVVADLALGDIDNPAPRADGAYAGPNGWVAQLEATELGRRWNASLQPGGPKKPKETDRRSCWPNSDAALGLFVVKAALSRRRPITLVNTPIGVQHFPWPVYSEEHGFSNRSIVFHGAKRSASRAWRLAPPRASGPFIAYNRTCDACDAMGWVSLPTSELAAWRCCGTAMPKSARARADKGGRRARPTAVGRPDENWPAYSYSVG